MKKQNKTKDIVILLIIIAGIFVCIGSSLGWISIGSRGTGDPSLSIFSDKQEGAGSGKNSAFKPMEVPESWEEVFDERNSISAEINIPDGIREYGFLKASGNIFLPQEDDVLPLFEDFYKPYKVKEHGYMTEYAGEDNLHLFLPVDENENTSSTCNSSDYIFMAFRDNYGTEYYNIDKYSKEQELDNFPIEKCNERIKKICDSLNLKDDIILTHYALDYRIMQEEALEFHMDGTDTKPDYAWTEEDNCYCYYISQTCNNIPLIPAYTLQRSENILNYYPHMIALSRERILRMFFTTLYDIHYEDTYEELLPFSDIMKKYRQIIDLVPKEKSTNVNKIELRVVAVRESGKVFRMVPVWVFYGSASYEGMEEYADSYAVFINGLTGEELG